MYYKKLPLFIYKTTNEDNKIFYGDNWKRECFVYDFEKQPVDITGSTIYITVKEYISDLDTNAAVSKEVSATDFIDIAGGRFFLELTPLETKLIGNYYIDVVLKTADEEIYSLYSGKITFINSVTKRK
jgi:hypothetical protein